MTARVAVATDSSSCLPAQLAHAWGVSVAPLQVIIDDVSYPEGDGARARAVVEALGSGRHVGTSQPTPSALLALAEAAAGRGAQHLVFVALSGHISGTAEAMRVASTRAAIPVTVVDSHTVALAAGFAALSAAAAAREGGDGAAVSAEAARVARSSLCLFTVDSLEYLRRGGRLGPATAAVGRALGVKPEMGIVDGHVAPIARHRSSARARQAVLDRIASRAPAMRHPVIGLMTMPGDDALVERARRILATRGDWPVVSTGLSAALAAHGGPGTLAAVVVDAHPAVAASL